MSNAYLKPVIQIPSALEITAISQSSPMTITVQVDNAVSQVNTYIVGMAVKLFVPYNFGMFQANNLVGTITAISGSVFTLNLDSSQFDQFTIPLTGEQPATIAPNGSRNYQYNNGSAQVPFQSLNNVGN